jgi:hypothetical protein
MKILSNTKIKRPSNAVNLTPECEESLFKIKKYTYAFYMQDEDEPFVAIKSEIFDLLMQRLAGRIVDMYVFRPLCVCCGGPGLLTIRMTEAGGCVSQFNEDDELELCKSVESLYGEFCQRNEPKPNRDRVSSHLGSHDPGLGEDPQINEATEIWKVPNLAPFNQMTVSNRAVELLNAHCSKGNPTEVLEDLWHDIKAGMQSSHHDIHVALNVASSIGDISVVEHLCGRVAIYLLDECPKRFRT